MTAGAILTLNAGSSSLKLALFSADTGSAVATGLVDRIGAGATIRLKDATGAPLGGVAGDYDRLDTHEAALRAVLGALAISLPELPVVAVGHRVVHGGPDFAEPVAVTADILGRIEALSPFAPLHQPHNVAGLRAAMVAFPDALQVACFDTSFHRGHAFAHEAYALPRAYFDKGIRRYGFHGLSYQAIAGALARTAPHLGRVVVAHLGNGASACALMDGRSVASSMGFTALDGLPMGTRPGQIDPGVVLYLMQQEGMDGAAISDLLYRRSGLLGLSGLSGDMRILESAPDPHAAQAIGYFTTRIRREIAALAADMGGIEGLVFTAGIGENSARVRAEVCDGLGWLGVRIDPNSNAAHAPVISAKGSAIEVRVIPTDEEGVIAQAVRALSGGAPNRPGG